MRLSSNVNLRNKPGIEDTRLRKSTYALRAPVNKKLGLAILILGNAK